MKTTKGLCGCGCGGQTPLATRNNPRSGNVKGKPTAYVASHGSRRRHGQTDGRKKTSEYSSYNNAEQRCNNPKRACYLNYGGRGIEFRFKNFEEFLSELGPKPEPKRMYSVDRKNTNGHYEVGNVKWSTTKEQSDNKRTTPKQRSEIARNASRARWGG